LIDAFVDGLNVGEVGFGCSTLVEAFLRALNSAALFALWSIGCIHGSKRDLSQWVSAGMECSRHEISSGSYAQTEAVYATLTASAKRNASSVVNCIKHRDADNPTDSYDVLRALVASYDGDREDITRDAAWRTVLRCHGARRPELLAKLADEAEYHGIAPLLEPSISALAREIPEAIPRDVRVAFFALASRHRRATALREKCIDQLLTAFAATGIPIILLKGAALAHLIYPAPELRPMVDIDALIDPADEERAVSTVSGLGYCFAPHHGSRFARRMHHLPPATMTKSGFRISLEIHLDAMSADAPESLTFATLSAKPRPFQRGSGPQGLALGHTDMLRHLVRHAFEPARRVRLKHLHDLRRYQTKFAAEIDWREFEHRFPQVIVALRLVSYVFAVLPMTIGSASEQAPASVGVGMLPLSEIANMPFVAKLSALFNPSPWWLHGYYGVPPGESLLICRAIKHPLTLARWFAKRLKALLFPRPDFRLPDRQVSGKSADEPAT
jgi:hypothetical protein